MRFQLWVYNSDEYTRLAVVDTDFPLNRTGRVLLRDQSSYPEDAGRFVWKNAAYPMAVKDAIKRGKGVKIAESAHLLALDANMNYTIINYMWESLNSEETKSVEKS